VLKISLRPSWLLGMLLALGHGAAIAIMLLVDIPLWAALVAAAGLAVNLFVVVRRHALMLTPDSAVAIEIGSDDKVGIRTRHGEWSEYAVLGNTCVTAYLTVLNLQQTDSRAIRRIAIFPDSVDAEDFRKLRVWLRWKEERGTP
jgi:toxin CptA